jgi:type VI secretion system protein
MRVIVLPAVLKRAFAALLLAAVSGCAAVAYVKDALFPPLPRLQLGDVHVLTDAAANLNTAVELEIIFVLHQDVLKKVTELTATKWFELREDVRKTYPGGFESHKWELVPGQDLRLPALQFKDKRALAAVVFANYLTPGEHRARIDGFAGGVVIRLLPRGFTVTARGDGVPR